MLQGEMGKEASLEYYVRRLEPYYGSGFSKLEYKGDSLDEAIRCFKGLPSAFGDRVRQPVNVLGVEYRLRDASGRPCLPGACDLIQESFDKPLFLSQDYRVMQVKDVPEVAEKAVSTLKQAFNLNAFGQLVSWPVEIDGGQWSSAIFTRKTWSWRNATTPASFSCWKR